MARLGKNNKNTEEAKHVYGEKDKQYQLDISRQIIEDGQNMSIFYLEVDWENSKKNSYGEITEKKFKVATGVLVRGAMNITQSGQTKENGKISNKMHLTFSIYTQQLKELNIKPKRGDYLKIGIRYYCIYKKTIEDISLGSVAGLGHGTLRCDYYAYEEDNELIQKNTQLNNDGEFNSTSMGSIL